MQNTVYTNSVEHGKAEIPTLFIEWEEKNRLRCDRAASGCDYPTGECAGLCSINQGS